MFGAYRVNSKTHQCGAPNQMKTRIVGSFWFALMLIGACVSAYAVTIPIWRTVYVVGFTVMCHMFGKHEGALIARQKAAKI